MYNETADPERLQWKSLVAMLGFLIEEFVIDVETFEFLAEDNQGPLPEDYTLCGFFWSRSYCREWKFKDKLVEYQERPAEFPSMAKIRAKQILWLAPQLVSFDYFLTLNLSIQLTGWESDGLLVFGVGGFAVRDFADSGTGM